MEPLSFSIAGPVQTHWFERSNRSSLIASDNSIIARALLWVYPSVYSIVAELPGRKAFKSFDSAIPAGGAGLVHAALRAGYNGMIPIRRLSC